MIASPVFSIVIGLSQQVWSHGGPTLKKRERLTAKIPAVQKLTHICPCAPRSLKSGLVLPTQIFGLFGPPKKRVNFDKFNQ